MIGPDTAACAKKVKPGDTLIIKSIDRLGRNYNEILEQWRYLTGELIADIVLQLLSYVAQTERGFIHLRQAEGITMAKVRGVQFGRRPLPKPDNFPQVYRRWMANELSARRASSLLDVSHRTFCSWQIVKVMQKVQE